MKTPPITNPLSILLSTLVLMTRPIASQIDLITNGGFVTGSLTPWNCTSEGNNTCGTLVSAPPQPDFIAFLDPSATLSQATIAGDQIPYLVQFDSYCTNVANATAFNCSIPFSVSLGSQSQIDTIEPFIQHFSTILSPSGTSEPLSFKFNSSSTTLNEQVYLDNVTLYALSNGPAFNNSENILENGGFEQSNNVTGIDNGWNCVPGVCCDLESVTWGQFAEEGLNYVMLQPGCSLVHQTPTVANYSYLLNFYGYCIENNTDCDTIGNLGIQIGNTVNNFENSNNFSFNLAKGNVFNGPYGQFNQIFKAIGNDTISITAAWPVRLDNFTLTLSSSSASSGAVSSKSKSNTGAIAGGVIGGLAALAIGVSVVLFWRRKRNMPAKSSMPPLRQRQPPSSKPRDKSQETYISNEKKDVSAIFPYESFGTSKIPHKPPDSPPLAYSMPALKPTRDSAVWTPTSPPPMSTTSFPHSYAVNSLAPAYPSHTSNFRGISAGSPVPEIQTDDGRFDYYPSYPSYQSYD